MVRIILVVTHEKIQIDDICTKYNLVKAPGRENLNLKRCEVGALQADLLQPHQPLSNVFRLHGEECVASKVDPL